MNNSYLHSNTYCIKCDRIAAFNAEKNKLCLAEDLFNPFFM